MYLVCFKLVPLVTFWRTHFLEERTKISNIFCSAEFTAYSSTEVHFLNTDEFFWKFSTKVCWSGALYSSSWMFVEFYRTKLRSIIQDSSWFISLLLYLYVWLPYVCFYICLPILQFVIFYFTFVFSRSHRRTSFIY